MTNLAESLIALLPCSPPKRRPFFPTCATLHVLEEGWHLSCSPQLLPFPPHSCQTLAPLETGQQPVLFSLFIYPHSSGGLIQPQNSKFISALDPFLHPTLIYPLDSSMCVSDWHYKFNTKVLISLPISSHQTSPLLTTSASL